MGKVFGQQVEHEEDIEGRQRYRFEVRVNEQGEIPFNALVRAKESLDLRRQLLKGTPRATMDAGIGGWEWLGPGNIGGRIRSIVIHPSNPNTVYIGAVSGGIWKSDNGGAWWYPLADFLASINVASLIMDPTNPSVLYAGTGEQFSGAGGPGPSPSPVPGAGIFKSVDAGATWNQLASTANAQFTFVSRIAHHPTSANTLLAATGSGVYRTTDGGTSWTSVLPSVTAYQVKYHPTSPSRALCATNVDFFLSTDGGINWNRETTGGPNKLPNISDRAEGDFAVTDASVYVNIVDRNNGEVWRSTDAGATWSLRQTGITYGGAGDYNNAIWVDPTNSNFIIVGGRNLQRSTDGGLSFTLIGGQGSTSPAPNVHADMHTIVPHPQYNGGSNKTVYVGCDGGIYRANDITTVTDQSGWTNLATNLGITQFYSGAISVDGSLIVGGAQDNDRVHYTPGRGVQGWYGAGGSAPGGDGTTVAVEYNNAARVYAVATFLSIGRSDDSGRTYTSKISGLSETAALWVSPFVIDPNNSAVLFAGGANLWKSTNRGDNWAQFRSTVLMSPVCSAIDVAKGNSNLIWAGYSNGQLSRTTDGGVSWTDFAGGARPNAIVTSISISPSSHSVVMVSYGGYINNNVWLTEDGGNTWAQRTGTAPNDLPAIQVTSVRFHPLNSSWIYAGTDLGVFASEDRGLTWSVAPLFGSNEGPVNVEVSQLFWQGSDYLIAATFGRGMFRSRVRFALYVDKNNSNAGDGTLGNPYRLIQDGANAQGNGTNLFVKTGTYQQGVVTFVRRGWIIPQDGPVEIR